MSHAYRCDKCTALFPTDAAEAAVSTRYFEFWGQAGAVQEWADACPECGSTELSETYRCDVCRERESGDGIDECEECFAQIEAQQDQNVDRIKELERRINP